MKRLVMRSVVVLMLAVLCAGLTPTVAMAAASNKYYYSLNGGAWTQVSGSFSILANGATTGERTVRVKTVHYDNSDVVWTLEHQLHWHWNSSTVSGPLRDYAYSTPMPFWDFLHFDQNIGRYEDGNTAYYSAYTAHFAANIFGFTYNEYPYIRLRGVRKGGCTVTIYSPSV